MAKRNHSEKTTNKFEADYEYIRTVEQLYKNTSKVCSLYIKIINIQEQELQQQKEIIAQMRVAQASKELQLKRCLEILDKTTEEITKPNKSWIVELYCSWLSFVQSQCISTLLLPGRRSTPEGGGGRCDTLQEKEK